MDEQNQPPDQNPPGHQPPVPPSTQPPAPSAPTGEPDPELKQWTIIMHLSAFLGLLVPSVGQILGPLIIWLIKKPEMPALDAVGKEVLNFQISWTIWAIASAVIAIVGSCIFVPIILPFALFVAWVILIALAAIKASNNEPFKYPLTIPFLK